LIRWPKAGRTLKALSPQREQILLPSLLKDAALGILGIHGIHGRTDAFLPPLSQGSMFRTLAPAPSLSRLAQQPFLEPDRYRAPPLVGLGPLSEIMTSLGFQPGPCLPPLVHGTCSVQFMEIREHFPPSGSRFNASPEGEPLISLIEKSPPPPRNGLSKTLL
jgi:hypothetical protein